MRIMKGFTLIELLISTFLGLIALSVITSSYSFGLSTSNNQLKHASLKSELDGILLMMADDIRRAGYCGDCTSSNNFILNDVSGAKSSLLLDGSATASSGTCIVFAYNEDSSPGVVSVRDSDARGYRWNDSNKDGKKEFEIYKNYSGLTNWSCSSSHWQDYNNPMVTVTQLDFLRTKLPSVKPGSSASIENLTITIQGTLGAMTEQRSVNVTLPNIAP
ncbi:MULTISPECIES: PilW family protein [Photobacterium]|uniref:PilW family protein n=1 Tax=Photobacterium TaxID=657 RepID=UPI001C2D6BDF|nr:MULTISPECIES: prepilin-type N-terminal cleavage/methylation domain-containing protein [Photobacterium]MBV1840782.1 prepilin-type N-terminal cleavage/methylation domain-containing protein [Photobacterium ganghwense]